MSEKGYLDSVKQYELALEFVPEHMSFTWWLLNKMDGHLTTCQKNTRHLSFSWLRLWNIRIRGVLKYVPDLFR